MSDKENLIWAYRVTLDAIISLTDELWEIEELLTIFPDEAKTIWNTRKDILNKKILDKRKYLLECCQMAVQEFWMEVINDL